MRSLTFLALLATACSSPEQADPAPVRAYATQIDVASPDYAAILAALPPPPATPDRLPSTIEPSAPAPANAKAIGDVWVGRLQARDALDGYGLSGKSPDGPVAMIHVAMAFRDFQAWTAQNGWEVPQHIRWSFLPSLNVPPVSEAAWPAIRMWPATTRRTGLQNAAALRGRITLRDGCFYVSKADGTEALAWFLAETGLALDAEGKLTLIDRISGAAMARVGEEVIWGGPNADPTTAQSAGLREACGDGPVAEVGNPQAAERFYVQYPHTRSPAPPPAGD